MIQQEINQKTVVYVDDFLLVIPQKSDAENIKAKVLALLEELGVPVSLKKLVGPTKEVIFLGIGLDSEKMECYLAPDKKERALEVLQSFKNRNTCTVQELQTLVGRLFFLTRVIVKGRAFLSRMIILLKGRKLRRQLIIRLNQEFKSEISWWCEYLPQLDRLSLTSCDHWNEEKVEVIYTDASTLGAGALYGKHWLSLQWPDVIYAAAFRKTRISMPYLELYSIALAIDTWKTKLNNKKVVVYSDCMPVVKALNKLYSSEQNIAALIRHIVMIAKENNFIFKLNHISTFENEYADLLSRLKLQDFKMRKPTVDQLMSIPVWPHIKN
jgi:hypothetical protein